MEILYVGPTGSGKTTQLLEKYLELGDRTGRTEACLTLVKNATSVSDWRSKVDLPQIGPLQVFTYFGFIQNEITRYWTLISEQLHREEEVDSIEPTFMNVETSHYLMNQLVEGARYREGAFASINATTQQIAVQLIDNLNHAAMNGLNFEKVHQRLCQWAASDQEKLTVYKQALKVMQQFRRQCMQHHSLDYSLIIDLYNQYLLLNEQYFTELTQRYQYLIVDNLEKTIPTAQDLILKLMQQTAETYLAFNPEGGFSSFFGGNAKLAEQTFFPICDLVTFTDSYTASQESRQLAQSLAERVLEGKSLIQNDFVKGEIQTNLRGDMLLQIGDEVEKLIEFGTQPGDIVLIAPIVDKVMDFTLHRSLTERGYQVSNLTRNKRLLDEPFAQALITLALLSNPEWKLDLNFSALMQTLSLVLKLDPVRSALLADEIFKNKMNLPDLDEIGLRPRLGFNNADKYDLFREWVLEKQTEELEMEDFFQIVFGELLAPLRPEEKDILACRQVIQSITKFKQVLTKFGVTDEKKLGEDFIEMVLKGTLAAEVLFRPPSCDRQILIATPYTFLFSPYVTKVKYLFWIDVASDNWFQSSIKELTNPYILSRDWQEGENWTDEKNESVKKEQLISYIQSLLSKCTDGLYIANSYLNSRGWEQDGDLLDWLQPDPFSVNDPSAGENEVMTDED